MSLCINSEHYNSILTVYFLSLFRMVGGGGDQGEESTRNGIGVTLNEQLYHNCLIMCFQIQKKRL